MADEKATPGSGSTEDPSRASSAGPDSRSLVDDLFDGGIGEAPTAQVPLDPHEFRGPARPGVDPPTERIDLEAAAPPPAAPPPWLAKDSGEGPPAPRPSRAPVDLGWAAEDPAEAPEHPRFGVDEPGEVSPYGPSGRRATPAPFELAPPEGAPPSELDLGFATGAAPPAESEQGDLLGLPLGSQPGEPAPAAPPRGPRLPCTAVVVAEDRAGGATRAAGLMAAGYTCRAATLAEAGDVLAEPGVDVAVVEAPFGGPEPGRLLAAIARWAGPTLFVGAGASRLELRPGWARVERPEAPHALVEALERARDEAVVARAAHEAAQPGAGTPPRTDIPGITPLPLARVTRRGPLADHVELEGPAVRALWVADGARTVRGHVRSTSAPLRGADGATTWQLLVELPEPPRAGVRVSVELILVEGERAELTGAVAVSAQGQALLELEVPEARAALLDRFLAEARAPGGPAIEPVRIRARAPRAGSQGPPPPGPELLDDEALRRVFEDASTKLDDDDVQQGFIQACIRADRLQLAVQCYRGLKEAHPEDERVQRYLNQVGTILGFYAFRKQETVEEEGMPRTLKWGLFAFVFAALILWVLVEVIAG